MQLTLIANAGFLLSSSSGRILVDGIHCGCDGFSPVPLPLLEEMVSGSSPFSHADLLCFTHGHPDHFSPNWTQRYLAGNPGTRGIFLPEQAPCTDADLLQTILQNQIHYTPLHMAAGQAISYTPLPGLTCRIFPCPHAGTEYQTVEHYCYHFFLEGKQLLCLGDSQFNSFYLQHMLSDASIDVLLVNPLFIRLSEGRDIITRVIRPKRLLVYHIPFQPDDTSGLRKLAFRNLEKYQAILPPTTLLTEPMQTLSL